MSKWLQSLFNPVKKSYLSKGYERGSMSSPLKGKLPDEPRSIYEMALDACTNDDDKSLAHIIASSPELLREKGYCSELPTIYDMLAMAAESCSLQVLRLLLNSQSQVTHPEMTPRLHQVAYNGGKDVYEIFLDAYLNMSLMELNEIGGPIPNLVLQNDAFFLHLLLRHGFDRGCLETLKSSPHSQSLQEIDQEVVDILAEFDLSLDGTNAPSKSLSPKPFSKRLLDAVLQERPSVIRYLLSTNPTWRVTKDFYIYDAILGRGLPVLRVFVEHEPDLLKQNYIVREMFNTLPLIIGSNDIPYIKFMLDHGADPNKQYWIGRSTLNYAKLIHCHEEVIELLESYGATMKGSGCIR